MARTIGDKATIALALQSLVKALGFQGEATQAMALLEEALALANEFDSSDAIFPIAFYFGLMARKRGDLETARHFLTECLVLAQATDHQLHFGYALSELGIALCDFADYSTAKSHICQGVASVYRNQPLLGHRHVPGVSGVAGGSDAKA